MKTKKEVVMLMSVAIKDKPERKKEWKQQRTEETIHPAQQKGTIHSNQ